MKIREHLPTCKQTFAPIDACGCMEAMLSLAEARVAELEARITEGQAVLKRRNEECDLYRGALRRCASAAGNPDPATGCRLVIYFVNEVIE